MTNNTLLTKTEMFVTLSEVLEEMASTLRSLHTVITAPFKTPHIHKQAVQNVEKAMNSYGKIVLIAKYLRIDFESKVDTQTAKQLKEIESQLDSIHRRFQEAVLIQYLGSEKILEELGKETHNVYQIMKSIEQEVPQDGSNHQTF